jgi:thymidylate kinase
MSSGLIADAGSPGASESGQPSRGPGVESAQGRLLQAILELFDANGVPYCILHGYKDYPARVASDVDCVIPAEFLPRQLATLLRANRDRLGAVVVQWIRYKSTGHCFVLATDGIAGGWEFLTVDVTSDYRGYGRVFYRGQEILASRSLERGFWIPSPALEFACYLVKKVGKRSLTEEHGPRLTELYNLDPAGCDREIGRFWSRGSVHLIGSVASSGKWDTLREALPSLRRELLWPGTAGALWSSAQYWATDGLRRLRRWQAPTGLHVVFLGADGAGKSTTIAALEEALAPVFRRGSRSHLAPALFRRARPGPVTSPHGQPPRSMVGSLAKAAYWLVDYTLGYYVKIRPALARSALILFDRYLVDALIDPRRYRYHGPRWLLQFIWWLIPKPDLVILLDAPPQVLRARKQEVSLRETERQRHAYLQLVRALPNGHIVDAAQPLDRVVAAVGTIVLGFLTSRSLRRLGVQDQPGAMGQTASAISPYLAGAPHENRAAPGMERNSA